jgi:hypothetical protein
MTRKRGDNLRRNCSSCSRMLSLLKMPRRPRQCWNKRVRSLSFLVIVTGPVGSGFVESLAQPGGNATGFTIMD